MGVGEMFTTTERWGSWSDSWLATGLQGVYQLLGGTSNYLAGGLLALKCSWLHKKKYSCDNVNGAQIFLTCLAFHSWLGL